MYEVKLLSVEFPPMKIEKKIIGKSCRNESNALFNMFKQLNRNFAYITCETSEGIEKYYGVEKKYEGGSLMKLIHFERFEDDIVAIQRLWRRKRKIDKWYHIHTDILYRPITGKLFNEINFEI